MSRSLVAYFSATGTTEQVGENLAKAIGATNYKIQPAQPYTADDLNWNNKQSRSSVEMADLDSRPAIKGPLPSTTEYDHLYIGFPIWWYRAPSIINTFLEGLDLTDVVIVPFATSGGSGMGRTNVALSPSCVGAILKEGKCFSVHTSLDELKRWAQSF
ncbi:flavodoxin [uncultured Veillonella sp.]|uniref:flavodoxin n=1 Tax=uncultured Veillonella sp. TaxID=159268 RepID=UPI0025DFBE18|nr:flavodoxin [uncultured Veillonella sp.]MDY3974565.1 flavodoxin [Veillonella caviae]